MSDTRTVKFHVFTESEVIALPAETIDAETLKLIMMSGVMLYHGRRLYPSTPYVDIGTREVTWTMEAAE